MKDRLTLLCEQNGIQFIQQEESYTSQASFLDGDFVPTFGGEKPAGWKVSGKRMFRGLYRSSMGALVNADAQAVGNLFRKVSVQLGREILLFEALRAALTLPQRYDVFTHLKKSYREKSEGTRLQPVP